MCVCTELDPIQRRVIDDVLVHKRNVFLTGSGGVGKSMVTKLLVDLLKRHYGCVCFALLCACLCAGPGIIDAAKHISALTYFALHLLSTGPTSPGASA